MAAQELGENHAPPNMVAAFKQLRVLYGEPLIPLKLGTDFHGGHTDMTQIEVGLDQMMITILPNHHEVPTKYQDSAAFFVVGHEFGHITSHPGKEARYLERRDEGITRRAFPKSPMVQLRIGHYRELVGYHRFQHSNSRPKALHPTTNVGRVASLTVFASL